MVPGSLAIVAMAAVAQPPVVFWASSPVAPGQIVMLCGSFPRPEALEIRVARLGPSASPAADYRPDAAGARAVEPLRATDTALMFELPDLGGMGIYCVWLLDGAGGQRREAARAVLNAPEIWSVVSDAGVCELEPERPWNSERVVFVQPGGSLMVLGRCLALGKQKPRAALQAGSGPDGPAVAIELQVEDWGPWYLRLRVPDDAPVASGRHLRLRVHNGYGGAAGWCQAPAVSVEVLPRLPLPPQVYELAGPGAGDGARRPYADQPVTVIDAADFGADGYDNADDDEAIREALDAAARAPGVAVVKLPPGRIFLREPLVIPPYTALQGAGTDMTAICIPDTDDPPDAWIRGSHHFAIMDLTIYCSNHKHVMAGDMSGDATKAGHVRISRVRVRADAYRGHLKPEQVDARLRAMLKLSTGGGDTARFSGPDVVVENSDLYGSGRSIYFYHVRGGVVRNNMLYNGRWGWYNYNVCRDVVIEGNTLTGADLMSTGGSYACYGPEAYSENIYTGRNTYRLMHGWDREAFTSDAGGGAYFGGVDKVDVVRRRGRSVLQMDLADDPQWHNRSWAGALVAAIAGKGRGFVGRLLAYNGRRVTVQPLVAGEGPATHIRNAALAGEPAGEVWKGLFDQTTRVTITQMHRRYVFDRNDFSDAGIAIQYYGTAIEHVAAANTCRRAGGYHGLAIRYTTGIQPELYCQWLGNQILEGNSYRFGANNAQAAGPSHLAVIGRAPSLNFGAVVRGNVLHNHARLQVISASAAPAVENVVVEGNTVRNSQVGLEIRNARNVLYRSNVFENCKRRVVDLGRQLAEWRKAVAAVAKTREPLVAWSFDQVRGRKLIAHCNLPKADMTAVLSRKPVLVDGVHGKALKFDGKTYAEVDTDVARLALNMPNFTIAAWIKPDVVAGRWGILAKRTGHMATPFVLAIRDGRLVYEATDDKGNWTTYNFSSPAVLRAGAWQHVAVVVQEGRRVTLYVDGSAVATRQINGEKLATNDAPLRIGWEAWGGNPARADVEGFFHGAIDELAIWPRALGADEIARLARR